LHQQRCFANLNYVKGDFPESENAAETTLALPVFSELSEEQIHFVAETVNNFTRQ
jgi:dTDP-4-amino-4,6-dideoxygalactose transaminase